MLYALHELERAMLDPLAELARILTEAIGDHPHPVARMVRANSALVHRIAREYLTREAASDVVILMALYPIAFVFTAVYSDGLFLLLSAGSFLAATQRRSLAAGVLGGLAVATRVIGLALLPALVVLLWPRSRALRDVAKLAPLLLLPLAVGLYSLYLHAHVGDAGAFTHAEDVFWHRSTPTLGPVTGLWDAASSAYHGAVELARHLPRSSGGAGGFLPRDQWASWNVVQFVLLVVAGFLTVVAWRRFGAAFGLYSAGTIVICLSSPAELVPLVSTPRYWLVDFPLFLALASLIERRPRLRLVLLCTFSAVGGIAALAFSRAVWIA